MLNYDHTGYALVLNSHGLMGGTVTNSHLKRLGMASTVKTLAKHACKMPFLAPLSDRPVLEVFDRMIDQLDDERLQLAICMLATIGHISLLERTIARKPF